MNRRQLLALLGPAAAGAALDPERVLWEPGTRVVFDLWTPRREWMPPLVRDFEASRKALSALVRDFHRVAWQARHGIADAARRKELVKAALLEHAEWGPHAP